MLIGILVGVLFFLPPIAGIALVAVFLLIGAWEWSGFMAPVRLPVRLLYVLVLLALAAAIAVIVDEGMHLLALVWLALAWWVGVAIWMLSGGAAISRFAVAVGGLIGLLPALFIVIQLLAADQGALLFIWVAAIVAAADTGAFAVGRTLGRVKLAPAISPGKTREGMLGGIVFAALAGAAGAQLLDLNVLMFTFGGAAIAIVSVVGDLLVSACKRRAGLKDSGWILPGHGGILDRIDGLLAALPLFLLLITVFGGLGQELSSSR